MSVDTRVIVNAAAGPADDLAPTIAAIREGLASDDVEVRLVHGPGDATELAEEAGRSGIARVVSAGGDGTLHAVVNGLHAVDDPPLLGVLPLGTGNDFARSIGVPGDLESALEVLRRDVDADVDLVRMELEGEGSRVLINASAGGFSGRVDEGVTREMKESWGPLAYLRSAVGTMPEVEDYAATLRFDDGETLELRVLNVVVANGRTVGGGLPVAPEALLDDGLLDVVVIACSELTELAALAPRIVVGGHLDHEQVRLRRCRSVEVASEPPMLFNADGELVGRGRVRYEVIPSALTVVVGEDQERATEGP